MTNPMTEPTLTPNRSTMLSQQPYLVHGITNRVPGMGVQDGNVGDTAPRDPIDAWEMRKQWAPALGIDAERIVRTGQVHGTEVFVVKAEHAGMGRNLDSKIPAIADAAITQAIDVPLMALAADCQPILIYDPVKHAAAAVHAGWRGTIDGIAGETVRAMEREFGTNPFDLLVYLGPAIGVCCLEVGPEVTTDWRTNAANLGPMKELAVTKPGEREHFDITRANTLILQSAGVRPENIEVTEICTKCSSNEWFSHRAQGNATGRQAGVIMLKERPQ